MSKFKVGQKVVLRDGFSNELGADQLKGKLKISKVLRTSGLVFEGVGGVWDGRRFKPLSKPKKKLKKELNALRAEITSAQKAMNEYAEENYMLREMNNSLSQTIAEHLDTIDAYTAKNKNVNKMLAELGVAEKLIRGFIKQTEKETD